MKRIVFTTLLATLLLTTFVAACTSKSDNTLGTSRADTSKFRKVTNSAGKELLVVDKTDSAVIDVVKSLTQGKSKDFKIERSQIGSDQIKILDRFAADSTGVADCQTTSVEGCNSCCADNISSSIRHTTCGDFCDKVCGAEPCH